MKVDRRFTLWLGWGLVLLPITSLLIAATLEIAGWIALPVLPVQRARQAFALFLNFLMIVGVVIPGVWMINSYYEQKTIVARI